MKNNLKQFKTLFVLLFVVFYSCEKDLYDEAFNVENSKKANVTTSTLKEVFKNEDFVLSYKKIPKKKASSSSEFSRSTFEENNGFTIIDAPVKIVDRDGVVTYTLLIERDNNVDGKLENLVLFSQPQNNEIGYVIKYNSFREDELTEEEVNDNGISEIEGILTEDNAEGRILYISYWVSHCVVGVNDGGYCGGNSSNPYFTHNCGHWEDGFIYIGDDSNFEGGGGSGGETVDDGIGGSGSGGISTSPVLISSSANRKKCFVKNLASTQEQWLFDNPEVETSIIEYLESTIEDEFQGCYDEEAITNVENFISVNQLLNQNENILLDIPCVQLPYWQTIAQHQVPNTVKTKIQNIDNQTGWFTSANIQSLGHPGNGAVVNMDFFPVTITQMPKWPSGVAYTQKELFNHIRLNINDFFDDLVFTPVVDSNYGLNETILWNSTNPLGAILSININPDEGSVVCSKFNQITGEWYFTTIEVPWDGTHPVSGNRAFGYYSTQAGDMVIYTRGVDRYSFGTHMLGNTGATLEAASQLAAFNAADSKWQNFQQKITNFVNQGQANGLNGTSNVNAPEKYRPNWNKVKNVLNGTLPISTLGCN